MREILDRLFDDPDDRRMIGRYVDGAWAGKLTAGNFLRFEALMQVLVHASGDSDMQILQCYAACREPNLNHYRLAALLARGHWIVTTNFDTLIEIACQRLSIPFSQIVYEADFHQFDQFPDKFPNPIFKIHGSFFKGVHNSRDSMIATLSALFASGERMSGEPYKQRVLERLVKSYPLVVMGYSGADNLDISPILKETASPETLLWINHSPQPAYHDAAAILRFPRDPSGQFFNPHLNILAYLAGGHADRETAQIHLSDLDTSQVLQSMTNGYAVRWPELGLPFQYDIRRHFDDYFAGRLAAEPARRLAQFHIWDQVGSQDGLQRVLPQVESLAGALQFGLESIQILCAAAAHYRHLGESEKSLQAYERALDLAGQGQDAVAIVQVYQGLSETHRLAGRGPLALFYLGQCVSWASQAIDAAATPDEKAYALSLRASALFSRIMLALQIGYPNRQDFDAAAVFGDFAYEKFDRYDRPHSPRKGDRRIEDDLAWQAGRLQRYIHMHVREAAIYCQQALDLAQQHSLDYIQSRCFSLFSRIAVALGNRQEADSWLSQSLEIEQRFGGLILCGALHEQMADVHRQNGDWDAYLGSAQQALHIYELVEDIRGVAEMNYALGYAYQHLGQWEPS